MDPLARLADLNWLCLSDQFRRSIGGFTAKSC